MGFKQYLKEQEEQELLTYENDKKAKLIDFVKTMDELNTDQFKEFAMSELGMTADEADVAVYKMLRDFLLAGEKQEPEVDVSVIDITDEEPSIGDDVFSDEETLEEPIIADEEVIDEFAMRDDMLGPHDFSNLPYEKTEAFLSALGKPEKFGIDIETQKQIISILTKATNTPITSLNILDKTYRDFMSKYSNDPTGSFMGAVEGVIPTIGNLIGELGANEMIDSEI